MKPLFGREMAEMSQKTWKLKEKCLSLNRQSPPRFPLEQRTRVELYMGHYMIIICLLITLFLGNELEDSLRASLAKNENESERIFLFFLETNFPN